MPVSVQSEHDQHALPAPHHEQKLLPAPKRNTGKIWRLIALAVLLLAAVAFGYWRIQNNKKEEAETQAKTTAAANRPIPVTVAAVQSKTMPIYFTALGTVTAYNTVTIKSRVDGQLLSVPVREGQLVRQGQVVATIDPRPYLATQAQAEGQLAKDEAAAAYSKAEAGRYTALYQAGVVSKESEQTQVSNANQSTGTLDADRAAIQAARVNVAYTRITSPINGVVGLRQVDAGNIVHAADATGMLVVTQLQPIAVIFTLPEDQLPTVLKGVRAGHKLVVEAFDRSESTHLGSGTLLTVDNQIDTTTGTIKAKAVFDNKDGALFPNQFVNVRLILEQRTNSLVVPASAIQTGANGDFVYVVKPCPAAGCPQTDAAKRQGAAGKGGKGGGGKGANATGTPATGAANAAPAGGAPAGGDAEGEESGASGQGGGGAQGKPQRPKYYVDVANVTLDLTEGAQVILKSGVNPGDQVVIDGQEKLKKNSPVQPARGTSNGGGPATQQIGADTSSSGSSTPQPSSPDQPNPATQPHGIRSSGKPQTAGTSGGHQ